MSGDRDALVTRIMERVSGAKAEPDPEYNPLDTVNALVRERIERRQRGDTAPDPLRDTPPSVNGGEHGEP